MTTSKVIESTNGMTQMCDDVKPIDYDHIKKRRAKFYDVPIEDYMQILAKDYDVREERNHPQSRIVVLDGKYSIEVDELLAPLLAYINKHDMLTWQSCQHGLTGYSSVIFYADKFINFQKILFQKARAKYGENFWNIDIIKRMIVTGSNIPQIFSGCKNGKPPNNLLTLLSSWYSGWTEPTVSVHWEFLHSDIPVVLRGLEDVLCW